MASPSDAFCESLAGDFLESKIKERINGRICPPYDTYPTAFDGGFQNPFPAHEVSGDCLVGAGGVDFFDYYWFIGCQPGIYRFNCSFTNTGNPVAPAPYVELQYQFKPAPFNAVLPLLADNRIVIRPNFQLAAVGVPVEFSFEWPMVERCGWCLVARVSIPYALTAHISGVRLHR